MRWIAIVVMVALGSPVWAAKGPLDIQERLGTAPLGPGFQVHYGDGPVSGRPPTSGWESPAAEDQWGPFFEQDRWTGVAWLKVPLQVQEEWVGADLTVWLQRLAPVSIYLDGRHIHSTEGGAFFRTHAAGNLVLDGRSHELTARIEAPNLRLLNPLTIAIGPTKHSTQFLSAMSRSRRSRSGLLVGAGGALGILHMLLFLFRRKQRANLFFGMTCLAGGALGTLETIAGTPSSIANAHLMILLFNATILLACGSGLRMMYELFHPRAAARGRLLLGACLVVLVLHVVFDAPLIIFAFGALLLLEQLRLVVLSNLRGQDGAWLLGLGAGAFSVAGGLQLVGAVFGFEVHELIYVEGYVVFLISISSYLARSFAKTQDRLEVKLAEVHSLSEHALSQERRLKQDEMQRALLEAENVRKEQELVEARKLQVVLDDLRQTQAHLVHQQKMASLGGLVAGIAHELNTPIGAISGAQQVMVRALEKLEIEIGDKRDEKRVQRILHSLAGVSDATRLGSARVDKIVKSLRRFAHLDEGSILEVQIEDGLRDTLVVLENEINAAELVIEDRMSALPPVICQASDLNQVFLNVIRNAIEASQPGGRIEIEARPGPDGVVVLVRDHGEGIPAENLARIFDPGFTTRGVGVGMGLGLSIGWKTITAHGGDISVDSELGTGTTVTISIPLQPVAGLSAST